MTSEARSAAEWSRPAPALRTLRTSLLNVATDSKGSAREQAHRLAEALPTRFDDWWQAGQTAREGPIDVIDIFSGCGGMSAGFRAINGIVPAFQHVLAIDIDTVANATYEHNLQLRPTAADVHELASNGKQLQRLVRQAGRRPGHPLILIGCAPCQGFSSHRNGAPDGRNELFIDFAAVAVQLAPDFIVIENVPELCTDQHWPRVEQVRTMLEAEGYLTHLAVHNLAEMGLAQERFRAVMVAARRPFQPPAGVLKHDRFRTVRDSIGALPRIDPGEVHRSDPMHYTAGHRQTTIDMIKRVPKNGGRRPFDAGPASLRALQARQGKPGFEDVYGRLHWDRPAITITAYSRNPASGRFVHPEQDRGLSVREAALLQGFPRDFFFTGGFDHRFRQIGNAVPPLVAAHVALALLGELLDPSPEGPGRGIVAPLGRSFSRLIPALKKGAARTPTASPDLPADVA